jgi:hypothetical protein
MNAFAENFNTNGALFWSETLDDMWFLNILVGKSLLPPYIHQLQKLFLIAQL